MKLNNSNILVAGVSGFAGDYVAKYLLGHGAEVSGLGRRRADGTPLRNLEYLGIDKEVELLEGERALIEVEIRGFDYSFTKETRLLTFKSVPLVIKSKCLSA